MVFLVAAVSFLANNIAAFLIVMSLIDGFMLIAPTYAIVALYLFIFSSSSVSFMSDAWTMATCDCSTFPLSNIQDLGQHNILIIYQL